MIQQFWTAVIFCLGIVMIVRCFEAVQTMGGNNWEVWYFVWEDSLRCKAGTYRQSSNLDAAKKGLFF